MSVCVFVCECANAQSAFCSLNQIGDAAVGTTTGASAPDRALTARVLANPTTAACDLNRPGHLLPLVAREGGVLTRGGHTEASVDLCYLAGCQPVALICELMCVSLVQTQFSLRHLFATKLLQHLHSADQYILTMRLC